MFEFGVVSRYHPISDYFLYGIDLIEIPSILFAITLLIAHIEKRRR